MSLRDQIVVLEKLAAIDADLRRIDDLLSQERNTLSTLKAELKKLDDKLATDRSSVADMERVRNDLMGEVRQMAQQIERSREKLSRSRNERESNAAQRELEELRKLQRDREDEINKLNELTEFARKGIEEADGQQKAITTELGGRESEISGRLAEVTVEREQKAAERAELVKGVQPSVLRRYDVVRQRKGNAIARASNGICLSCHMSLPPMLFQKLMRGEAFDQCPSCARILYYWSPPPDASPGEPTG